jgi:hypothetical protein
VSEATPDDATGSVEAAEAPADPSEHAYSRFVRERFEEFQNAYHALVGFLAIDGSQNSQKVTAAKQCLAILNMLGRGMAKGGRRAGCLYCCTASNTMVRGRTTRTRQ